MAGLPYYIAIPRFLPADEPPKDERRRERVPDDVVKEMRRLHEKDGRSAKWIWAHYEQRYSYKHVTAILRGNVRAQARLDVK